MENSEEDSVVMGEIIEEDNKWYGVPPKGEQNLPNKQKYVLMVFLIIGLEICIWAVYRKFSAPYISPFGSYKFYFAHIIAAPTIHLIPILLFWRYIRKERGHPFVFTKKLLMSGIIVGFIGAIIWRLLEEFGYDAVAGAAGGTAPGTLTFFNLLDPPLLFSLMTFVQFFVVGPVEELEFRGFAQDQAARVLPNWQALVFSSILFGCSHIPIALFVYQFPPHVFVAALWGWISAGFVFGVLYIYSRNIFACIVLHGMGNWQLSVFYFQSAETTMEPTTYALVNITTNIIADGLIILFFFVIHKYYWQPHRRGEPAFGGIFQKLQDFMHEHDFERKPIMATMTFLVAFCVLICAMILGITLAVGDTDLSKMVQASEETEGTDISFLESLVELSETETGSGSLTEGQSETISLKSEPERYINKVMVTVTWTDEPSIIIPFENQPDTFSVTISGPNSSVEDIASNPIGGEGSITAELSFTLEELAEIISSEGEEYEVTITIILTEAGNQEPPFGLGLTEIEDDGNDYNYEIKIIWLVPE